MREATPPEGGNPGGEDDVFRLIVENAVDVIVRGDAARNRIYVSPSSRDMLGYEPAEMLGKHAYALVHPDDLQRTKAVFSRIGPNHPVDELTFRMRRADGTYIWVGARYRHLAADNGLLAVLRDITAQKQTEEALADACMKLGLVMLDVDYFKAFNEQYGHLEGDDCLRRVSCCVHDTLQRPGDLAARYGGEEIAVLLPATDRRGTHHVAARICAAVSGLRIEHAASAFGCVTVSAGIATFQPPAPGTDPASLIKAADVALYAAKAAGRNRVGSAQDRSFVPAS